MNASLYQIISITLLRFNKDVYFPCHAVVFIFSFFSIEHVGSMAIVCTCI